MQNEIGITYLPGAANGQRAGVHAVVGLFLEWHQKDLQRRCSAAGGILVKRGGQEMCIRTI